jgi:cytochrome c-type biogenesis protein CcmF
MMPIDVPTLGNVLIGAILLAAAWTFSIAVSAARGRPHLLPAVRGGMYTTIATIVAAVFLLAYAFQSHDFRIRYVQHYSDRTMSPLYLWTALWGGQDGSLLWWSFLLGLYSLGFTLWIRNKYQALQAYTFASLASVFGFFAVLMLFAANPFATSHSITAPIDGEGLNPLLQNYWMAIHPPALYLGLTGWAIPASLAVAALLTGRLGEEWILAARRWVLLVWGFLTLGNMLGMFWSYEELGWGGYWAWDPVENASFMPWLLATAYLHSVMIQERRGMLKVWNVSLLLGTFFLTIFGTFLTRSGLIASVHSFARSDIGIWFAWYMVILAIFFVALVAWRLPELGGGRLDIRELLLGFLLSGPAIPLIALLLVLAQPFIAIRRMVRGDVKPLPQGSFDSVLSREFTFLLNNWMLLGMLSFVLVSTTWPLLSEAVRGEVTTVGPGFYNQWMVPFGLCLLFLMGVGPVVSWRKATGKNLLEAFRIPAISGVVMLLLHGLFGSSLGYPAFYESEPIYDTMTGDVLAWLHGWSPLACTTISGFVMGTVIQEFWRATAARRKTTSEGVFTALTQVIARARRRFGGYIVHTGVVLSFLGFMGAAYDQELEASLAPGESLSVSGFTFEFDEARDEIDIGREMLFADLTVHEGTRDLGTMSPGKFLYRTHPDMPTTEVAIRSTPGQDLYTILSSIDATGNATVRVIVRPFVWWIWMGGLVALLGVFVAAFPSLKEVLGEQTEKQRAPGGLRPALAATLLLLALGTVFSLVFAASSASAQDETSTLHAGNISISDPTERQLFERLLCRCGDCPRLPLSTCSCSWAENMRGEMRTRLAAGATLAEISDEYRERFGTEAIAIPSDSGMDRLMWALPLAGIGMALVGLYVLAKRWQTQGDVVNAAAPPSRSAYDEKLDEELRRLDDE